MIIKILITTTLILSASIMLIGCGEEGIPPPANVRKTTPSEGESIAANGIITVRFDKPPVKDTVKVNSTPAEGT